jgi:hypothetical protein
MVCPFQEDEFLVIASLNKTHVVAEVTEVAVFGRAIARTVVKVKTTDTELIRGNESSALVFQLAQYPPVLSKDIMHMADELLMRAFYLVVVRASAMVTAEFFV